MVRRNEFQVLSESDGATGRIALVGELDIATVPAVESAAETMLAGDVRHLTIDLAKLTFVDSSGVRLFLLLKQRADQDGWTFAVAHLPQRLRVIFELTGVDENLPLIEADQT